jgi:membrane protease YdiL (CAAX protease family)
MHEPATYGVAFAWLATACFLFIGACSLGLFDLRPHSARDPVWLTDTRLPLPLTLASAVIEELTFRGVLLWVSLSWAEPIYGLFALNLVFAACHARGGLTFAMSAGFFGMLASVMTLASVNLLPAICMHLGWNLLVGVARLRENARLAAVEQIAQASRLRTDVESCPASA